MMQAGYANSCSHPRRRQTPVNLFLALGRLCCLASLLFHAPAVFLSNEWLCSAVYVVFPAAVLAEKMNLTVVAATRCVQRAASIPVQLIFWLRDLASGKRDRGITQTPGFGSED